MSIWDNLRKKRQRTTTITVPESVPMWADPEAGGLGIKTIEARTLVGHAKSDQLQFAVLADVAAATGEHAQAVSGIMRAGRRELEKRAKAEGIPIDEMGKRIQAEAGMDPRKALAAKYSGRAVIELLLVGVNGEPPLTDDEKCELNDELLDPVSAEWTVCELVIAARLELDTPEREGEGSARSTST